MAGFSDDVVYANNIDLSGQFPVGQTANTFQTNGQLLIGSTALNAGGTHINMGRITSPNGTLNIGYNSPNITMDLAGGGVGIDSFTTDLNGPVAPDGNGNVAFTGATNVFSDGAVANTMRLNVQGTNHALFVGRGANTASTSIATGSSGQILQSAGASADPSWTTATYPSTAGTSGNVLTSNGTNWISSPLSIFAPNSVIQLFDDFIGVTNNLAIGFINSQLSWRTSTAPGFFNSAAATENNHPGIMQSGGAFSSANVYFILGQPSSTAGSTIVLGGGAIDVNFVMKISTLSNVTNRYILRFGLGDIITTSDQTNGVYFEYSDNINSGNWVGKTASASSRSTANGSTAVDTNWHNFKISINAAATSASFYVDGVQIANSPLATNIPTASGISPIVNVVWSAGTIPSGLITLDLFYMQQTLTAAR